MLAYSK